MRQKRLNKYVKYNKYGRKQQAKQKHFEENK